MDVTIENQLKYENYKEQFKRLNKALANGFNLEAMFIEYAILEDRTESILRHGSLWEAYLKKRKDKGPTINSKITYIQRRMESGDRLLKRYFSDELFERILEWKDERNRLIHTLLNQQLGHNEVRDLAEHGYELVKEIRSKASSYNRATEKAKG